MVELEVLGDRLQQDGMQEILLGQICEPGGIGRNRSREGRSSDSGHWDGRDIIAKASSGIGADGLFSFARMPSGRVSVGLLHGDGEDVA